MAKNIIFKKFKVHVDLPILTVDHPKKVNRDLMGNLLTSQPP